jgi:DNA (cytosine-5)-methyltransferase 1
MPRDADSRTLAHHLTKYVEYIDPDYVYIENVREFLSWGPMEQVSKISKGVKLWKSSHKDRKREIHWVSKSHEEDSDIYKELDLVPWDFPIKSRKGEDYEMWLSDMKEYGYTYDLKFLNAADFGEYTSRIRYFGVFARTGFPIQFPKPTHSKTGENGLPKWKAVRDILDLEDYGLSIFSPTKMNRPRSEKTLDRVLAGGMKFIDIDTFIINYNGQGEAHSIEKPIGTITCKERHASVHFMHYEYGNATNTSLDSPVGTLTTNPKANLVTATKQWTFDMQYSNLGRLLDRPAPTLIAQMEKKPQYLASAISYGIDQSIDQEGDNPAERRLRAFMRERSIRDIYIRMLHLHELKVAQGFPDYYELAKNKGDSLKFLGNSVNPKTAKLLADVNYETLHNYILNKNVPLSELVSPI